MSSTGVAREARTTHGELDVAVEVHLGRGVHGERAGLALRPPGGRAGRLFREGDATALPGRGGGVRALHDESHRARQHLAALFRQMRHLDCEAALDLIREAERVQRDGPAQHSDGAAGDGDGRVRLHQLVVDRHRGVEPAEARQPPRLIVSVSRDDRGRHANRHGHRDRRRALARRPSPCPRSRRPARPPAPVRRTRSPERCPSSTESARVKGRAAESTPPRLMQVKADDGDVAAALPLQAAEGRLHIGEILAGRVDPELERIELAAHGLAEEWRTGSPPHPPERQVGRHLDRPGAILREHEERRAVAGAPRGRPPRRGWRPPASGRSCGAARSPGTRPPWQRAGRPASTSRRSARRGRASSAMRDPPSPAGAG